MLRGFWCFPMTEGHRKKEELGSILKRKMGIRGDPIHRRRRATRHVFTHQVWRMKLYPADRAAETPAPEGYAWIPAEEIPTAMNPLRCPESCQRGQTGRGS